MKILYFFSIYELFFRKVSLELQKAAPNFRFSGIVTGLNGLANLKKNPFPWEEIFVYSDFLRAEGLDKPADIAFLRAHETELGIPNLTQYIASDRFVSAMPYEKALRILELCIRFVDKSIASAAPDLVIMDDVCCMLSYLIYKIAKKRGLPVWSIGTLKLENRISIYDDCLDQRQKIASLYESLPDRLEGVPRAKAENFLKNYRANYKPLSYLKYKAKTPTLSLRYLWKFFGAARNSLRDPLDLTHFPLKEIATRRIKRFVRHHMSKSMRLFSNPEVDEKFVYFPLQAQPERTTLILAPFYLDQIALAENIARSLPIGYKLYIKEHPISIGRRPLQDYQRLNRIFNVRLIRTEFPSQELIERASGVVTISNTVGLEAVFFQKPVLVLGDTFYNIYRKIIRVDNVKDLPSKLQEALFSWQPDEEELLRFVSALLNGSYPGTRRHPVVIPEVMTDANIKKVAAALAEEIQTFNTSAIPSH